jgi:TPR repeat protein
MNTPALPGDPYAAWDSGNFRTAFRLFAAQAHAGDHEVELNLGYFYDVGLGTRKNRVKAMYWYRRAYRRGSGAAASNIATIYRDECRHALEFAWYKRAAALRDGDAEVEIAKLYLSGSGVRKDHRKAMAALRRALASPFITPYGCEEAAQLLDACRIGRSARRVE